MVNRATMHRGALLLGHEVLFVDSVDEINEDSFFDSCFYGNVGFTRKVINMLGYEQNWLGHVPPELQKFALREIKTCSLLEALKMGYGTFIKPIPEEGKKFNGFVYSNQMDLIKVVNVDENNSVIVSEAVNFVSEWRCYILKGEMLDSRNYSGNFRAIPDFRIADEIIKSWDNAPIAYSCDIGLLKDGRTAIVECNDVMSLGSYGVAPTILASMLEHRWTQIHQRKSMK